MAIGTVNLQRKSRFRTKDEVWFFTGSEQLGGKQWLVLDMTHGTLMRGKKKNGPTARLSDIVDISMNGSEPMYLVIDFADAQWRITIRGGYENQASELIEKVVTWQRQQSPSS